MRLFTAILLAVSLMSFGCDGCSDSGSSGVWKSPTNPPPDNCDGCPEIDPGNLSHGIEGTFLQDPSVDDELVQWSTCMHSYMDCVDEGGAYNDCVSSSECPSACKDAVLDRYSGNDDYEAHADAIEAVFMNEGGLCTPAGVPNMVVAGEEVAP